MKIIFKTILIKLSRVIFWLIPEEFKANKLQHALDSELKKNLISETLETFGKHIKKSLIFYDTSQIREYAVKTALLSDKNKEYYYLEFGVFKGTSANFFSKYVKKLYAFDSFQGLSEDWPGRPLSKGYFNQNKKIPYLNSNIEPIVGWVDETLDEFLNKHKPKINFVHLDMDVYTPTKFTLQKIKPYLVKNAIIIFDELYNYIGWEDGEYKALIEVFKDTEYEYKAFGINSKITVIQLK